MVELKDQDFQIFKDEAQYWIDQFGLLDWRIGFAFEKIDGFYAESRTYWYGRTATLVLNKWQDEPIETEQIRKSAFHEVCEVLLTEMRNIALNKSIASEEHEDMFIGAAHGVIRRLENSVFKNHIIGN